MVDRFARPLFVCLLLVMLFRATPVAAAIVAAAGDASIAHDTASGGWQLSAGGATLSVVADGSRDFAVTSLVSPTGRAWLIGSAADSVVRVAGRTLAFGSRAAGFDYQGVTIRSQGGGFELRAVYALTAASLVLTRHYAIVPGSPS